jgi:hypothetical protein
VDRALWCLCAGVVPMAESAVSPRTRLSSFPAPQTLAVVTPSPLANLCREIGRRRHGQPSNPAQARHQMLGVHLISDDRASIKPDRILAIRWRSGRSDPPPHPFPAAGPDRSIRLAPRSLTPLARSLARSDVILAPARALPSDVLILCLDYRLVK